MPQWTFDLVDQHGIGPKGPRECEGAGKKERRKERRHGRDVPHAPSGPSLGHTFNDRCNYFRRSWLSLSSAGGNATEQTYRPIRTAVSPPVDSVRWPPSSD